MLSEFLCLLSIDLQSLIFPCNQPFSVVSSRVHLTHFMALLLSTLRLLISSEKPGDEICLFKKKKKTITKEIYINSEQPFSSEVQKLYCMDLFGLLPEGGDGHKAISKKGSCFVLFLNVFKYFWPKIAFQVW